MADRMKVKLLRPLNGDEVGSTAEYDAADAKRLEASGAVAIVGKAAPAVENKKEDAPSNKAATTTRAKAK